MIKAQNWNNLQLHSVGQSKISIPHTGDYVKKTSSENSTHISKVKVVKIPLLLVCALWNNLGARMVHNISQWWGQCVKAPSGQFIALQCLCAQKGVLSWYILFRRDLVELRTPITQGLTKLEMETVSSQNSTNTSSENEKKNICSDQKRKWK